MAFQRSLAVRVVILKFGIFFRVGNRMNSFKIFNAIVEATEQGKQLSHPKLWADRASSYAALVAVLQALSPVFDFLEPYIYVKAEIVQDIFGTLSILGVLVVDRIHVASNKDAGN